MNEIRIEESMLSNDIRAFEEAISRFTQNHYQMVQKADELHAVWTGASKEAFVAQYQADCELLNELRNLLIEMQEAMKYALTEYERCDQDIEAVAIGIRIQVNS